MRVVKIEYFTKHSNMPEYKYSLIIEEHRGVILLEMTTIVLRYNG